MQQLTTRLTTIILIIQVVALVVEVMLIKRIFITIHPLPIADGETLFIIAATAKGQYVSRARGFFSCVQKKKETAFS